MKLLHLYYDLMNLYGEYGNVEVVKRHLIDQGMNVEEDNKTVNDIFEFDDYDFVYCGSGIESNLKYVLKDLIKRKDSLLQAINNNKIILFTGNSMELLGKKIDNTVALNIFDYEVKTIDKRISGDVIVYNNLFGEVVGFINKSTLFNNDIKNPLFEFIFKDEGLKLDKCLYEGNRLNNLFVTHLIGPILNKNPKIIKHIIYNLVKDYKEIEYEYENKSYDITLKALKDRL